MTRKQLLLAAVFSGLALLAGYPAAAQDSSVNQIDALQSEIQQLRQQLQTLQNQVKHAQQNAAQAQAKVAKAQGPTLTANGAIVTLSPSNRLGICTADLQNCVGLTSRLQLDFANDLDCCLCSSITGRSLLP
jgi:outer membrane murein-binding lipoprotein Lpp